MNFFKNMFGYANDLNSQLKKAQFQGSLFEVVKDARKIIFPLSKITFGVEEHTTDNKKYNIIFQNMTNDAQEYTFPIHVGMELVTFSMTKNNKVNTCFEWVLNTEQAQIQRVGCYMTPEKKQQFKDLLTKVIHHLFNDQNVKDHLQFCKELKGIPIYKDPSASTLSQSSKGSKIQGKTSAEFNQMLIIQASNKNTKYVHSASCYQIFNTERKLLYDPIILVVKAKADFEYEIQLSNQTGFLFLRKEITPSLTYEVNTDVGYVRWLQLQQNSHRIIEVSFSGQRDAALSFKFAIMECIYQLNSKRNIKDAIAPQQFSYVKNIDQKPDFSSDFNKKIVKTYQQVQDIQQIDAKQFYYSGQQAKKGLEKYRTFTQGKIHSDISIASLGSMLQMLKISQDNQIKRTENIKVHTSKNMPIEVLDILLHEGDTKAMLHGEDGNLYYQDLQKQKIIEQYSPSKKGIQHICPQFKLAEAGNYKTFKAVSLNTIYRLDPRSPEGVVNMKAYTTSPQFCQISTDSKGRFAAGSLNGQIRLYEDVGKNANCKFPAFGDPVQHLQSTKDGKWLLATFKTYLLLLPTETEDDESMYQKKINMDKRPRPIKLQLRMEHLQLFKIKDLKMIPAKFDERADSNQRFIVSGCGKYAVIWNLANIVKDGNTKDYKFTKVDGEIIQADFRWNNVKKLIMTTDKGISIKQNIIAK